ncbi:MAG TPA: penicillin-binding protein 2 [Elusimicrobiota bacterium]|nr:penicillin-binding protein 2 [Elusimicrobiota bacterium]
MTESLSLSDVRTEGRLKIVVFSLATGFVILSLRLFQLQVIHGSEMLRLAELNRTQTISLRAPRGTIIDSRGEILLDNAPSFSVFYSALSITQEEQAAVEKELVMWLPDRILLIHRKMGEARRTGKTVRILQDIPRQPALALIEKKLSLPGVNIIAEPKRRSRFGLFAGHLLGYVDEISPRELSRRDSYHLGQTIGKSGLEKVYEEYLHGLEGGLRFEMDATGRHVRVINQILPKPGMNLHLTLDRRLQEAAERGLQNSSTGRGAAVVLDPRTGAVKALASYPEYNVAESVASLLVHPDLPLFDRAVQGTYPIGSIFKIIDSAALLEEGQWDPHRVIYCDGMFRSGKKDFACWKKHGRMDFWNALVWSCNVYFYNVGLYLGPDRLEQCAKMFGMGRRTGIDIPGESAGLLPGIAWKKEVARSSWFDGDTVNFSIGQGPVLATPIQVAQLMSAVANGGVIWKPYVLQRIVSADGKVRLQNNPQKTGTVSLAKETWERLWTGLQRVVVEGTARSVYRADLAVGGKTGTAQNPHGEDHAWFGCYAGIPGEPPSLAIAVFVENGGRGSAAAGPIARSIIEAAFPSPEKKL